VKKTPETAKTTVKTNKTHSDSRKIEELVKIFFPGTTNTQDDWPPRYAGGGSIQPEPPPAFTPSIRDRRTPVVLCVGRASVALGKKKIKSLCRLWRRWNSFFNSKNQFITIRFYFGNVPTKTHHKISNPLNFQSPLNRFHFYSPPKIFLPFQLNAQPIA